MIVYCVCEIPPSVNSEVFILIFVLSVNKMFRNKMSIYCRITAGSFKYLITSAAIVCSNDPCAVHLVHISLYARGICSVDGVLGGGGLNQSLHPLVIKSQYFPTLFSHQKFNE